MSIVIGATAINTVKLSHFGTNFLFDRYQTNDLTKTNLNSFGATSLRYPGGANTEFHFSVQQPNATTSASGQTLVPFDSFVNFTSDLNTSFTLVIPTRQLMSTRADRDSNRYIDQSNLKDTIKFIQDSMKKIFLDHGADGVHLIDAIEIGNEYWGSGGMTGTEYGRVVNRLAPEVKAAALEIFGPLGEEIKIAVQMGSPWSRDYEAGGRLASLTTSSDAELLQQLGLSSNDFHSNGQIRWSSIIKLENMQIINQLSEDARSSISALVEHYYLDSSEDTIAFSSRNLGSINLDFETWENAGLTDLDLYITEWNVSASNSSQFGLRGAGAVLFQFEAMLRMGVDAAYNWAFQHNTVTDLAGNPNRLLDLSPSGALLQHLAEHVVGYDLLDLDEDYNFVDITAFQKSDSVIVYLTSRIASTELTVIDLSTLTGELNFQKASLLGVDMETSDGSHRFQGNIQYVPYFLEHDARAQVSYVDPYLIAIDSNITASLRPYEILILEYGLEDTSLRHYAPSSWVSPLSDEFIFQSTPEHNHAAPLPEVYDLIVPRHDVIWTQSTDESETQSTITAWDIDMMSQQWEIERDMML